jgi:uncharacterized membrane protein YGL010W
MRHHPHFDRRLALYAPSHQKPRNEAKHPMPIPAIMNKTQL